MADSNFLSYDLPNFIGELFQKGRRPNTFLQLIGGVNGWTPYASWEFPVGQEYQIPAHDADRSRLEGANAPDHAGVVRAPITNVTQIVQEKVKVSYTKEGSGQQLHMASGVAIGGESDPVMSELDFQTGVKLELIARNLNWTFLNQEFRKPSDNTATRRTRGILEAITTNVVDAEGEGVDLDMFDQAFMDLIAAGGTGDGENVVALANTAQLVALNNIFRTAKLAVDTDRFVGGVRVRTVWTTFGVLNFALERDLPQDTILLVDLDSVGVVATPIPSKGVLFREELAKVGSSFDHQIYGELGLDHGPEWMHAKIEDLGDGSEPEGDGDGGDA